MGLKNSKNPENLEPGLLNPDLEFRIPENFGFEFFLKLHFRGGLCYKFFLKNDFNPLKNQLRDRSRSSRILRAMFCRRVGTPQ